MEDQNNEIARNFELRRDFSLFLSLSSLRFGTAEDPTRSGYDGHKKW